MVRPSGVINSEYPWAIRSESPARGVYLVAGGFMSEDDANSYLVEMQQEYPWNAMEMTVDKIR